MVLVTENTNKLLVGGGKCSGQARVYKLRICTEKTEVMDRTTVFHFKPGPPFPSCLGAPRFYSVLW